MSGQFRRAPIVLVEDDPKERAFVRQSLRAARIGNPLVVFERAEEARHALGAGTPPEPSLFIIDLSDSNGESGLAFLGWLREQPEPAASAPVLLLADAELPYDEGACSERGVQTFLRKPVTAERLADAVQRLGFVVVTSLPSGEMAARIIERR